MKWNFCHLTEEKERITFLDACLFNCIGRLYWSIILDLEFDCLYSINTVFEHIHDIQYIQTFIINNIQCWTHAFSIIDLYFVFIRDEWIMYIRNEHAMPTIDLDLCNLYEIMNIFWIFQSNQSMPLIVSLTILIHDWNIAQIYNFKTTLLS